jgi:RNA polymerase sigma-70 factor (ECF subfamily)
MDLQQLEEADPVGSEQSLRSVEDQDTTRRMLDRLSPREAEVITCVDVVGLDVRSTAAALEMTVTAVRVARHRGLVRLRRLLEQDAHPAASPRTAGDTPIG